MRAYLNYFLFLFLLIYSINSFSLSQDEKLWAGFNAKQTLNDYLTTFIFTQIRAVNKAHPWQVGLLEGGMGYHFLNNKSFWIGYQWAGHDPYNGFYQVNRLFQQFISNTNLASSHKIISRTRLEEIKHGNSSRISVRLRQRLMFQMKKELISNINPLLYDEIFFQLHNTPYTTNNFISENRVFIGFNLNISDRNWLEIGYINQYRLKTPKNNQNTMSHIASFTYNIS
jgi:hypothetical protein